MIRARKHALHFQLDASFEPLGLIEVKGYENVRDNNKAEEAVHEQIVDQVSHQEPPFVPPDLKYQEKQANHTKECDQHLQRPVYSI